MENKDKKEAKIIKEEIFSKGDWIALKNIHWEDENGEKRIWESVSRTTKGSSPQDCVEVLVILRCQNKPDTLVFVKQFRPSVGAHSLEMVSGLIDAGETVEETIKRELLEETGLTGKIIYIGPCTAINPGLTNETMRTAFVVVDGDSPENKIKGDFHGIDGECIELILIPVGSLSEKLNSFAEEGIVIDARLYSLAIGIAFNNYLK